MTTVDDIITALTGVTFTYANEIDLHRGIDQALTKAGIDFEPEVRLNANDRIDYLIGTIGVEVKVAGTTDALRRQLTRYAANAQIGWLLVITTRPRHMDLHRKVLGNTLVQVHTLGRLS